MTNEYFDTKYPITPDYLTMFETLINRIKVALLAECDLTLPQYRVLACLEFGEGAMKAKDLSGHLDLSPATVTYTVDGLEKLGLVKREFSERDRRTVSVAITPEGNELIQRAHEVCDVAAEEVTAPLGDFLKENTRKGFETSFANYSRIDPSGRFLIDKTFLNISLLYKAKIDDLVSEIGIPLSGVRIVFELNQYTNGLKATELAHQLLIKLSQVVILCNELVDKGYIARQKDPIDRRASILSITSKGYELLREVMPRIDAIFMQSAESATSEERFGHTKTASIVSRHMRKHFRY